MATYKVVTKFRTERGVNFRHTLNDGDCTADAMREAREQLAELHGEAAIIIGQSAFEQLHWTKAKLGV